MHTAESVQLATKLKYPGCHWHKLALSSACLQHFPLFPKSANIENVFSFLQQKPFELLNNHLAKRPLNRRVHKGLDDLVLFIQQALIKPQ